MFYTMEPLPHSDQPTPDLAVLRLAALAPLHQQLKKERRKLEKMSAEMDDAAAADLWKKKAELLAIHQSTIAAGTSVFECDDIYVPGTRLVIELDPAHNVPDNIRRHFKMHKKMLHRQQVMPGLLAKVNKAIDRLQGLVHQLENAPTPADIERLRQETPSRPIALPAFPQAKEGPRVRFREYTTSTGCKVFVGKADRDNDQLTFRLANPHDYWFHVLGAAGSHVVLRLPNRDTVPDPITLRETAGIAAFHSKLKNGKRVPVNYTQVKFVRKPRGAKPGLVYIEREKTLFADPSVPVRNNPEAE